MQNGKCSGGVKAGRERGYGGRESPEKSSAKSPYRGLRLCLFRFFSLTRILFFLPVRLVRFLRHGFHRVPTSVDVRQCLSPEYTSIENMSIVEYDSLYGNRGDTVNDTIHSMNLASCREIDLLVLPEDVLDVILTKAHDYADKQCDNPEDREEKYFKCFDVSVRKQKRSIRNNYFFKKNMVDSKPLLCDRNSSLRNGCDYGESVAVMVGNKHFINDNFHTSTTHIRKVSKDAFIKTLFSLAQKALDSANVDPDDWAGDDGSLAIVLRGQDTRDQIEGSCMTVVDVMCPKTWRILATAIVCEDVLHDMLSREEA